MTVFYLFDPPKPSIAKKDALSRLLYRNVSHENPQLSVRLQIVKYQTVYYFLFSIWIFGFILPVIKTGSTYAHTLLKQKKDSSWAQFICEQNEKEAKIFGIDLGTAYQYTV